MKKLIIFDLDGTLLDTSEGILHCYNKTAEILGLEKNPVEYEACVIGGPLSDGFRTLFKISDEKQLGDAINIYRRLYQDEGIKLFNTYDGIKELLVNLKENGYLLAVATLKAEEYAKQMLEDAGLSDCFDIIHGWDGTENCTKAFILTKVLYALNTMPTDAVLVGDSVYDEKGADIAGTDFLGVSYGFGIKKLVDYPFPVADSPEDISDYIINAI